MRAVRENVVASARVLLPIIIGTCLFEPVLAAEQQQTPVLAPVVSTATRSPQRVSDLTADVTVISREQIERAGQSSLAQILQSQAGLQTTMSGGLGGNASVFVRGTNSDHVVVLIDGVRVSSSTVGSTAFQQIPPSQIERIEIVRGPASSLYGADAIGGVIQIFTRAPEGPPALRASAGYGTYRTEEYTLGFGGRVRDTTFNINAGYLASGSISATRPSATFSFNPDRDPYRDRHISARLAHRFSGGHELGGTLFGSDARVHFDSFPPAFDHYIDQTVAAYSVYSRNRLADIWTSTLRLARGVDDATAVSGAVPSIFKTEQNQASWQNEVGVPFGDLLVAAEYRGEKVSGSTPYPVSERTTWSGLAGYTGRYRQHTLQANIRHDDNSQFGGRTTGSVGYGYAIAPGWAVSGAFGTAFKAPSFNQLYFPGFGNPNLRPESSRNIEGALRYESGGHSAGVVAYRNRVRDLIVNVPIPATFLLEPQNANRADIKGATVTYGFVRNGWSVRANADFVDPEDESTGNLLPRRAQRHGAVAVSRDWGPWSAGVDVFASGARYEDAANTLRLGGYAILNVFASYRFDRSWSLLARINNVLDKDYELVRTFNTPGANAFVVVRYEPR